MLIAFELFLFYMQYTQAGSDDNEQNGPWNSSLSFCFLENYNGSDIAEKTALQ